MYKISSIMSSLSHQIVMIFSICGFFQEHLLLCSLPYFYLHVRFVYQF